jgi:hypothetical protein
MKVPCPEIKGIENIGRRLGYFCCTIKEVCKE